MPQPDRAAGAGWAAPLNRAVILVPKMLMDVMMTGMITGEWGCGQEGIVPDAGLTLFGFDFWLVC
jgi:hypothetical protein